MLCEKRTIFHYCNYTQIQDSGPDTCDIKLAIDILLSRGKIHESDDMDSSPRYYHVAAEKISQLLLIESLAQA